MTSAPARAALGPSLGFVPTMGALHAGHLSLVDVAKTHATKTAVSIFVNPTQFGPHEDFHKYPRPLETDLQLCTDAGVDIVFAPSVSEMYPPGEAPLRVDMPGLFDVLEGPRRPGHFSGVCQVVAKLFNIVQPSLACFGEKDFQQLTILRALTKALDFPIDIVGCPTLRDPDGLAMSSRNRYLSGDERKRALSISRSLRAAQARVAEGERDASEVRASLRADLLTSDLSDVPVELQYAEVVDIDSLQSLHRIEDEAQALVAMKVGTTRLIDNIRLRVSR
ncbi:MAG: pantoate--beta-alanine ligase [Tepidisphaeraceae bacterium]